MRNHLLSLAAFAALSSAATAHADQAETRYAYEYYGEYCGARRLMPGEVCDLAEAAAVASMMTPVCPAARSTAMSRAAMAPPVTDRGEPRRAPPVRTIDRPLVLRSGQLAGTASVGGDVESPAGADVGARIGLPIGELGAGYRIPFDGGELPGVLAVSGSRAFVDSETLTVGPRVDGIADLSDGDLTSLAVGVQASLGLFGRVALIAQGRQLDFSPADGGELTLALPIAVGVQITDRLYGQVDTELASLTVSDGDLAVAIDRATPLAVSAIWAAGGPVEVVTRVGGNAGATTADADVTWTAGVRVWGAL